MNFVAYQVPVPFFELTDAPLAFEVVEMLVEVSTEVTGLSGPEVSSLVLFLVVEPSEIFSEPVVSPVLMVPSVFAPPPVFVFPPLLLDPSVPADPPVFVVPLAKWES